MSQFSTKPKNSAVMTILATLGLTDTPKLTPEQESQFEIAKDPNLQHQKAVIDLFTPKDS